MGKGWVGFWVIYVHSRELYTLFAHYAMRLKETIHFNPTRRNMVHNSNAYNRDLFAWPSLEREMVHDQFQMSLFLQNHSVFLFFSRLLGL